MHSLWSQNCISRAHRFPCYSILSETTLCEDLRMCVKEMLPKYLLATSVLVDGEGSLVTDWLGLFRLNLYPCISSGREREMGEAERAGECSILIWLCPYPYSWFHVVLVCGSQDAHSWGWPGQEKEGTSGCLRFVLFTEGLRLLATRT